MEETLKLILDKLNSMDTDIKDLKKHTIVIENKLDNNSKALFDGYKQTYENTTEIKNDIKEIKVTLTMHDTKLQKIK